MEINGSNVKENTRLPLSVIILSYNEEKNIGKCLNSVAGWVRDIIIVDSYSTDSTLKIAKKYTSRVYQHSFEDQASQLNWALSKIDFETEWIFRLDSDEIVTEALKEELISGLQSQPEEVTGLYVPRKVYFLGRWIKHGGYYPTWLLRLWRAGKARSEQRKMDEHMILLEGRAAYLKNDIIDDNRKNIHWWIQKHNDYASREAIDILNLEYRFLDNELLSSRLRGSQETRKRWLKENFYVKLPLFIRPCLYFVYRYVFKLGFFDGKEGLIWHFLQGFWYRFLVDTKVYEIKKLARNEKESVVEIINRLYGEGLEKPGSNNSIDSAEG